MSKKLVGGDFLLDVSSIELEETSTLTNITDKNVINQLTNLKTYIPNPSMIKPIWVKLKTDELVVTRGSLSVVDSDEFEIDVILNGYTLKIHIKFTQVLNENDDPIDDWYIDTNDAKYLFTTNNFATFKVADVKNIDGEILSQLKCGDVVIKEDASGEHAYIVSYRGETGICLTYADASVIETQSYDLVDDAWVYNSEDKTKNLLDVPTKDEVEDTIKDLVEGGTMTNAKPIYCHPIQMDFVNNKGKITMLIFNNSSIPFTKDSFINWLDALYTQLGATTRLMISGGFITSDSKVACASYMGKNTATTYYVIGTNVVDASEVYMPLTAVQLSEVILELNDGVNKIN